jgi:hypothetical protein
MEMIPSQMELRLDRVIELAEPILTRLQTDEKLSNILPQARFLAEVNEDAIQAVWLDCEIHGRGRVPAVPEQYITLEHESGAQTFDELHMATDPEGASVAEGPDNVAASKYKTSTESIIVLEQLAISGNPEQKGHLFATGTADYAIKLRMAVEAERILAVVRSAVHQYVSKVWLDAVQRKDNIALVGLDYQIVLANLDALETGVGQELEAALDNLRSTNPANWSASAMVCRTVIIKLGNSLWKVPCEIYYSNLDQKEHKVGKDKEKNRLLAYIDCHHQHVEEQEHKDTLKQLHNKVWKIYETGSKGKRGTAVRHEEARTLVVDTFEFVNKLDEITELKPLESI